MPRIRCSIRGLLGRRPFPFVTFFLRTPHFAKPVDALIDTGSPFTVLSTNDVLSSRLPITKMQSGETVSLAGYRFFNHQIRDATLSFRTETDELFKANLPSIRAWVDLGQAPPSTSLLEDPELTAEHPELPFGVLLDTLKDVKSVPKIVEYLEVEDKISVAIADAMVKKKTPKQALDWAASEVEAVLKKAGYYG